MAFKMLASINRSYTKTTDGTTPATDSDDEPDVELVT